MIAVGFGGLATSDRALAATRSVNCGAGSFPTIQAGVDAAVAGDTVLVCNGTYAEQVTITTSNITLQSQSPLGATIKAPPSMPATPQSAVVRVAGATGVTIRAFTISGPGAGACGSIGYGVLVDGGGSATVAENRITAIRDEPFSGCQSGKGIGAGLTDPNNTSVTSPGSVTATGNTIDDFQKGGIDLRGVGSVNTISDNTVVGAGPTATIAQNGIQISRGAGATLTGNRVAGNAYTGPQSVDAAGILVLGPVGGVTISKNALLRNDVNIWVFNAKTSAVALTGNATTDGLYGIIVNESTNVVVEKNVVASAATAGLNAGPTAAGNTFRDNVAKGSVPPGHDCLDESNGNATAGTANSWAKNIGETRSPDGICAKAPLDVVVPPVIVLPPGSAPAPAKPPGQKVGDEIITKMKQKRLRSCVIEIRSLGTRRILVARGVARAPATGTGRMVIGVRIKPKGTKLLTKNFGGVIVNMRALCRSTSGVVHVGVKGVRAVLWIEHALTPPGSWVPDQPILTDLGLRFMQRLRSHMRFVRLMKCEGYTATYPPSPAFPPTLSLNRAKRVCSELKHSASTRSARVKLVPHGLTDPIATNNTEAGRRVNRRVFVTVVHFRVLRG